MGIKFLKMAVIYALFGIGVGIVMAMNHDFANKPVHAHANLVGWLSMAAMGMCYQVFPSLARSPLASVHFWLHNAGLPVLLLGIYLICHGLGELGEALAGMGSLTVALGFAVFAANVWKNAGAERRSETRWPAQAMEMRVDAGM